MIVFIEKFEYFSEMHPKMEFYLFHRCIILVQKAMIKLDYCLAEYVWRGLAFLELTMHQGCITDNNSLFMILNFWLLCIFVQKNTNSTEWLCEHFVPCASISGAQSDTFIRKHSYYWPNSRVAGAVLSEGTGTNSHDKILPRWNLHEMQNHCQA